MEGGYFRNLADYRQWMQKSYAIILFFGKRCITICISRTVSIFIKKCDVSTALPKNQAEEVQYSTI